MRYVWIALVFLLFSGIAGAGAVLYGFYHYGRGLPEYSQLAHYEPPTVTRVHAGDGRLLAEFAVERRVFVPIVAMPRRVASSAIRPAPRGSLTPT